MFYLSVDLLQSPLHGLLDNIAKSIISIYREESEVAIISVLSDSTVDSVAFLTVLISYCCTVLTVCFLPLIKNTCSN
jgi:hypothetical protein